MMTMTMTKKMNFHFRFHCCYCYYCRSCRRECSSLLVQERAAAWVTRQLGLRRSRHGLELGASLAC